MENEMIIISHKSTDVYEHDVDEQTLRNKYAKLLLRQANSAGIFPEVNFTIETFLKDYKILWYQHFPDIKYRDYMLTEKKHRGAQSRRHYGHSSKIKTYDLTKKQKSAEPVFPKTTRTNKSSHVVIDGDEYNSIIEAAKALDLAYSMVRTRCHSKRVAFANWIIKDKITVDK